MAEKEIINELVQEMAKDLAKVEGVETEESLTLEELEKKYLVKKMVVTSLWYPIDMYIKFYVIKWYLRKEKLVDTLGYLIDYFIKKEIGVEKFNQLLEENKEKIKELLRKRKIRVVCRH